PRETPQRPPPAAKPVRRRSQGSIGLADPATLDPSWSQPRAFSADPPTQLRCFGGPTPDPPKPWRRREWAPVRRRKCDQTKESRACFNSIGSKHALVDGVARQVEGYDA